MASPVRLAKIRKQLEAAGYRLVRINSSHHIFDRPGGPLVLIPVHNNLVKPFYAKQVAKIVAADKKPSDKAKPAGEQDDEGQGG